MRSNSSQFAVVKWWLRRVNRTVLTATVVIQETTHEHVSISYRLLVH